MYSGTLSLINPLPLAATVVLITVQALTPGGRPVLPPRPLVFSVAIFPPYIQL